MILEHQRGESHGRRGITPFGLEYDFRRDAYIVKLLGHEKAVHFIANDEHVVGEIINSFQAQHRLLQHRVLACERQKLLRVR